MGIPEVLLLMVTVCAALAGFAFWIWMLIDCLKNEPDGGNTKVIWVLVIVLAHFIGALIYYFVRRPERWREVRG